MLHDIYIYICRLSVLNRFNEPGKVYTRPIGAKSRLSFITCRLMVFINRSADISSSVQIEPLGSIIGAL